MKHVTAWPLAALLLAACASGPAEQAAQHLRAGQPEAALAVADAALAGGADDKSLRLLQQRARTQAVQRALAVADRARAAARWDEAQEAIRRVLQIEPGHARAQALGRELERERRHAERIAEAEAALRGGRTEQARALLEPVLAESPRQQAALALLQRIAPPAAAEVLPPALAEAFRRPVTLEFRDAPLRSVFESLARGHGLNVVFDRDVRTDTRVTLFLRQTTLDEALRLVLGTQQLARRVLNANTLLVYPDTPAKQRQHQELVTRTLYLTNADPKSVVALIRTIAKTQDIHQDDRLNAIVVRDTPAVVRLIEDLVATVDLPEPEVTLELEVLEVASSRLAELGLQWPEQVDIGLVDGNGNLPDRLVIGRGLDLRASIANPALVAAMRGNDGSTHTLANPSIRARNREKAQVHVGEKLPVFTTTSAANVGVSASVSYLDVGIKLDVQPVVQLDNEVSIRVELEVSSLLRAVSGPAGSVGYQLGTRRASTALRLRDGETQVLAGLLNDEERRTANGLPGLSELPVLGRLFGVQSDSRSQTEVVLLITPRVVRNIALPPPHLTWRAAGTAADPGAAPLRLGPAARAALPAATGNAARAAPAAGPAPSPATAGAAAEYTLRLSSGGGVSPGGTVAVTLDNPGDQVVTGSLAFDATLLANAAAGADDSAPVAFEIPPRGQLALVLRARPGAEPGRQTEVRVDGLAARGADGTPGPVTLAGEARIEVRRAP